MALIKVASWDGQQVDGSVDLMVVWSAVHWEHTIVDGMVGKKARRGVVTSADWTGRPKAASLETLQVGAMAE